jgi:hypothetical protein
MKRLSVPLISTSIVYLLTLIMQKTTFDLQASWDKINRFEERLRANRCSALYPNLFAAKFKDEYERERRKKERDARAGIRVQDGDISHREERRYA